MPCGPAQAFHEIHWYFSLQNGGPAYLCGHPFLSAIPLAINSTEHCGDSTSLPRPPEPVTFAFFPQDFSIIGVGGMLYGTVPSAANPVSLRTFG